MQSSILALVSTYNSERYMANRLDNLLMQTVDDLTIYILDCGSEQNEGKIVKEIMEDPRAQKHKIIYERLDKRIGLFTAWNYMIKSVATEFITNANTDDTTDPEYYHDAIEFCKAHNTPVVSTSCITTRVPNQPWPPIITGGNVYVVPNQNLLGNCPVWKRELHHKFGYFDESYKTCGDYDWWLRLRKNGIEFPTMPKEYASYLDRSGTDNVNLWYSTIDIAGNQCCWAEKKRAELANQIQKPEPLPQSRVIRPQRPKQIFQPLSRNTRANIIRKHKSSQ